MSAARGIIETPAQRFAEAVRAAGRPEVVRFASVELQVTDLDRAVRFWVAAFGLRVRRHDEWAELGTSTESLIVLRSGAARPAVSRRSGLYHVAVGMSGQAEFSRLLARLIERGIPFSPVDHVMSKALYLDDPDGLGIEITYETPERFGGFAQGFLLYDSTGNLRRATEPLDVHAELMPARGSRTADATDERTRIAHLHLHVPDLEKAVVFYERLGFVRNLVLPHMGFADLGAGGVYTHRLAVNTWQGEGVEPAPEKAARLLSYRLRVDDGEEFEKIRALPGLRESSDGTIMLSDPAGVWLRVERDPAGDVS